MRLSTPAPVPGGDAHRAVVDQLRRAEYHRGDKSFFVRAWEWVGDRLDSLFSGSPNGDALLAVLVLLAAVVILAVVRSGLPRRSARGAARTDPLAPEPAVDHRRRAEELTAAGQRAEALREWLRAAVRTIEERGVLVPSPGRTGAATAREAGPLLPGAATELARATAAFDEVWFGGRAATDADVDGARLAAEQVLTARISEPVAEQFALPR